MPYDGSNRNRSRKGEGGGKDPYVITRFRLSAENERAGAGDRTPRHEQGQVLTKHKRPTSLEVCCLTFVVGYDLADWVWLPTLLVAS